MFQRRLDFWLISSSTQEDVESVDILPAIKSNHSAIKLLIKGIEDQRHGPSFWKFNESLVDHEKSVSLIKDRYGSRIEEDREIKDPREDPRVLWDYIKY